MQTHVRRAVDELGYGSTLFVSRQAATRLVIFVHGFWGEAVDSWDNFRAFQSRRWWQSADVLFVGYGSRKENTLSVVHRLHKILPNFFPQIPKEFVEVYGHSIRPNRDPYRNLSILGHSLGGVIVRRLMVEFVKEWLGDRFPANILYERVRERALERLASNARPALLAAEVSLFSPATGGFQAKGWPGVADGVKLMRLAEIGLRYSPAFRELKIGSSILSSTKEMTMKALDLLEEDQGSALRPKILWANPDHFVVVDEYPTDPDGESANDRNHRTVCKPERYYQRPWELVEGAR